MPIESTAGPHLLIAVIPTRAIETRFLNDLNEPANIGSLLLNEKMSVLAAEERRLVGANMAQVDDPRVRLVAQEYMQKGARGTRRVSRAVQGRGCQPRRRDGDGPTDRSAEWQEMVAGGLVDPRGGRRSGRRTFFDAW